MEQAAFDERYGAGAHERLLELLRRPCVTFAGIATRYGVSRERVRQWHQDLLPQSPAGRQRRRACAQFQQKRRLFENGLFRTFVRHVRAQLGDGRVSLIQTRHGFRSSTVRLGAVTIALRDGDTGRYRGDAAFVFIRLGDDEFVFVPAAAVRGGARRTEFRNTFAALPALRTGVAATASAHQETDRP